MDLFCLRPPTLMEEDITATVPAVPEDASIGEVIPPTIVTMDVADADMDADANAGADANATVSEVLDVAEVPDDEGVFTPELFSPLESDVPQALANMAKSGVRFCASPREIWSHSPDSRVTLKKGFSVFFKLDSPSNSQKILGSFDEAGVDIDSIVSIQYCASNKYWVVSFTSVAAKEAALRLPHLDIEGSRVLIGDRQNAVTLVKLYEAPLELPDSVLIGRLSTYGTVLSFRRDRSGDSLFNGNRTARMRLSKPIPSSVRVVGEFVRIWYPGQPQTCRRCGALGHFAAACRSVRCANCEEPGHLSRSCPCDPMCSICMEPDHSAAACPFLIHSADVDPSSSGPHMRPRESSEPSSYAAVVSRPPAPAPVPAAQPPPISKPPQVQRRPLAPKPPDAPKESSDTSDESSSGEESSSESVPESSPLLNWEKAGMSKLNVNLKDLVG